MQIIAFPKTATRPQQPDEDDDEIELPKRDWHGLYALIGEFVYCERTPYEMEKALELRALLKPINDFLNVLIGTG